MFGRSLRCSFCRRTEREVAKLVAGPRVYICDRCVAIAARIMKESGAAPPAAAERRDSFARRIWRRVFPGALCSGSAAAAAGCAPSS